MRLSELSIERPVLATVMSLLVVVAGGVSWFLLPVREYPDVDNPLVSVTTLYAGASPETVEATITEPLERVLNGIEGIRSVQSTSAFGQSNINVEFVSGRDIDFAATDVANAVQRALGELPEEAERPLIRKAGANSRPIMWISVFGERYSPVDLTDIADRFVKTPLQLLPGVAQVLIGGERRYAMRIWLDPAAMASHGVDALDVRRTIVESNLRLPAGEIEARARKFVIDADAQIQDPAVYDDLIIREDGDVPVRIRDVGWAQLGSENYETITRFSRTPVVGIGIVRQSRANELAVTSAVRAALPEIRETLPAGADLSVAVDNTIFVEASLVEVGKTLAIALAVVVIVNLFYLRSRTTTTIAGIAIPISLVGTFAVMQALGRKAVPRVLDRAGGRGDPLHLRRALAGSHAVLALPARARARGTRVARHRVGRRVRRPSLRPGARLEPGAPQDARTFWRPRWRPRDSSSPRSRPPSSPPRTAAPSSPSSARPRAPPPPTPSRR